MQLLLCNNLNLVSFSSVDGHLTLISCSCGPMPECRWQLRVTPAPCFPLTVRRRKSRRRSWRTTWTGGWRRRAQRSTPLLVCGMMESFCLRTPGRSNSTNVTFSTALFCMITFSLNVFCNTNLCLYAGSKKLLRHHQTATLSDVQRKAAVSTSTYVEASDLLNAANICSSLNSNCCWSLLVMIT